MDHDDPSHVVYISVNSNFETNSLRISYQSMTTPQSTIYYDFESKKKSVVKVEEVLGDFDSKIIPQKRFLLRLKMAQKFLFPSFTAKVTKKTGQHLYY